MASRTKMGQFLKKRGSSQVEAAELLGMRPSAFSMKARGFSEGEKEKLARHYSMTEDEAREVFGD